MPVPVVRAYGGRPRGRFGGAMSMARRAIYLEWEAQARRLQLPCSDVAASWRYEARHRYGPQPHARVVQDIRAVPDYVLWGALFRSRRRTGWPSADVVDLSWGRDE